MSLSEKQEKYLKSGGIECPSCGEKSVAAREFTADKGGGTQEVHCENCGATWTDEYKLVGFDNLEEV